MTALLTLLCDQPEIAQILGKISRPVRVYRYRSHLVIFAVDDLTLQVIRVVHSRSNWQTLLGD
jgi:toxin ParE1/3/4